MDSLIKTYQKMSDRSTVRSLLDPVPRFLYLHGILSEDQQDIILVRMNQIDSDDSYQEDLQDGYESGESWIDFGYESGYESGLDTVYQGLTPVFGEYPESYNPYQSGDSYEGDSLPNPHVSRETLDQEIEQYWKSEPCINCLKGTCRRGPLFK